MSSARRWGRVCRTPKWTRSWPSTPRCRMPSRPRTAGSRLIVDLIDKEPWSALSADVKGDIYEGLLEKNAQDTKSGAGQYFTPRVLIDAIVEVMRPQPGTTIIDPAAGTGGFLLSAASHIAKDHKLGRDQIRHLETAALHAVELVASTARLCAMNLLLHGLGNEKNIAAGKTALPPSRQPTTTWCSP